MFVMLQEKFQVEREIAAESDDGGWDIFLSAKLLIGN